MSALRLASYLLAVVVTAAAALFRGVLSQWIGVELPYITFFAAIVVAAWYGGWWPGVLATVLSAVVSAYWFIPAFAAQRPNPGDVLGLGLFLLVGGLISAATEQLHRARRQIDQQRTALADVARARAEAEQGVSSERRLADRAQALLAAVVESSDDAILTKTLDGLILSWNAGAERMFGYAADEVVGTPVTRLVPANRQSEEADLLHRVSLGERVASFETERVARNGDVLDISVTLSPIRDESGSIVGASSIARDIRARKALEASLREADRRKDDFLAVLAHELRNPLAPIRNSAALLRLAGTVDPSTRHAAEVIERQVQHMARLLDDLLDVSRITRNRLELRRERVTLREVLDAALETTRPLLESQRQAVTSVLPEEPVYFDGDPVRLAQVFANLLSNASKYSDAGADVRLTATLTHGTVVVEVLDEGIGIAPEMLPHVFEMFAQSSQAIGRLQGGLGIGLALVKGLVELHGGRVDVDSDGRRGSRFTVVLPIDAAPGGATASVVSRESSPARRVLVVDDNRDSADSLAQLLATLGHDVRTVYDGESAIAEAGRFRPHVVLLDLGMPGLDGLQTARRLRAAHPGEAMFLVAVTGWGQARDRHQTHAAGFDAHLVKPVAHVELGALMQSGVL